MSRAPHTRPMSAPRSPLRVCAHRHKQAHPSRFCHLCSHIFPLFSWDSDSQRWLLAFFGQSQSSRDKNGDFWRRDLCLRLQVTRPLSYTKRQFDVEEEDVDKLTLRWGRRVCRMPGGGVSVTVPSWFKAGLFSQGGPVERQQPEVWRRVPGRGARSSAGPGSGWGTRRLVRVAISCAICGFWFLLWFLSSFKKCFVFFSE